MNNIFEVLDKLSPEDRAEIRRSITGAADYDRLIRKDVYNAIRHLRVSEASLANKAYQRALSDVQRAISKLPYIKEPEAFEVANEAQGTKAKGKAHE